MIKKHKITVDLITLEKSKIECRLKQGDTNVHEIEISLVAEEDFDFDNARVYYSAGFYQDIENLTFIMKNSAMTSPGVQAFEIEFLKGNDTIRRSGKIEYMVNKSINANVNAYDKFDELISLYEVYKDAVENEEEREQLKVELLVLKAELEEHIDILEKVDISILQELQEELESSLDNSVTLKRELDNSIEVGNTAKNQLDTEILEANIIDNKLNETMLESTNIDSKLKQSVNTASTVKSDLDGSITLGNQANDTLNTTLTNANSTNTILETNIGQAEDMIPRIELLDIDLLEDMIPRIELIDTDLLENVQGEIITARTSTVTGKTYDSVGLRLENIEEDAKNLAKITQKYTIDSWDKVQELVRTGLHTKAFEVGDQFIAEYNGQPYIWDIIGINHDIPANKNYTNSLTLQAHDCLMNCQFSASQALYTATNSELSAGQYYFEHDGTSYNFTLTKNLPVGGQLTFPWGYNTDILTTKISSFTSNTSITASETVDIAEGTLGTKLVKINDINRCRYGSNNYNESAIRQFLNSDEDEFVWQTKTDYDRVSTGTPYDGAGFLKLLDSDLVNVLGVVEKQVARNTVTDGGGQDTFTDKVFLLSRVEVYGGIEGLTTGEKAYEYYSNMANAPDAGNVDWRIKYLSLSPRHWWLRSPAVGYSHLTRYVHPSGSVRDLSAILARGVSPACVII